MLYPVDDSQGKITGSTYVEIINHGIVGRNVFGGGNQGEIGGDTKVIVNSL